MQKAHGTSEETDIMDRLTANGERYRNWWKLHGQGSPFPLTKRKLQFYIESKKPLYTTYKSYRRALCSLKYHPKIGGKDPEGWEKQVWFSEEIQRVLQQHKAEYTALNRRVNRVTRKDTQEIPFDNEEVAPDLYNSQSCRVIQGPIQRGFVVSRNVNVKASAPTEDDQPPSLDAKARAHARASKAARTAASAEHEHEHEHEHRFSTSSYKWRNISVRSFKIPVPSYDPYAALKAQYTGAE